MPTDDGAYELTAAPTPPPPGHQRTAVRVACHGSTLHQKSFHDDLQRCDGEWARTLARGAWLLTAGSLLFPIGPLLAILSNLSAVGREIIDASAAVFLCGGLWLLTTRELNRPHPELAKKSRILVRSAACMFLAHALASLMIPLLSGLANTTNGGIGFGETLFLLHLPLAVVLTLSTGYHLRQLALRLPDDLLARRLWTASCGLVGTFSLFALLVIFVTLATINSEGIAIVGFLGCSVTLALPFILAYLWGLYLLSRLTRDLSAVCSPLK